jgi:predicted ATPase/DNA-binding winged helix-turn-helix (wHTH) protein
VATGLQQPLNYRFDRFELQPAERQLLAAGTAVAVGPRAFDLLVALVERSGHLITKDELLERVWPGVIVEDNALQAQISILRKIVGPNAIATVSRSGYRFSLELTSVAAQTSSAPIPSGVSTPTHNLPQSLTSFIGREKEITELEELLGTTRLLTLTGSGGCGKTRLALQLAAGLRGEYSYGVWLVELAALSDSALVPQAVAGVLGIKEQGDKSVTQTVAEYIASREMLLVLDNAEHLLEGCAQFADYVLQRCTKVVVMVTSREQLRLAGELTYRVPSLAVPDPLANITPEQLSTCESACLFIERARLQQPQFAVTARNAAALASVCWRLDGIPLAIELAAPCIRSMTVQELNQRLDQRFGLLTGGSRTALPRQRTLRSLIDWSYDLLSDVERALLCRLSVFSGGWTLEAAEAVCSGDGVARGDTLELLTALIDKGLALAEEHNAATRYRLLETVRQYARDRLAKQHRPTHWRDRHLAHFLALAEEGEEGIRGAEQAAWLERLEAEHDNLREALAWSATPGADAAAGLRMAGALFPFWMRHSHLTEGRSWVEQMLSERPDEQFPMARAKALNGAGYLATMLGDFAAARALHEESLAIRRGLGDRRGISVSLNNLAMAVLHQDGRDHARSQELLEESLAIRRELDDQWGIAICLNSLGSNALDRGDPAEARVLEEESLAIRRRLNDRFGIANSLINLGEAAVLRNDHTAASDTLEEAFAIAGEIGEQNVTTRALHTASRIALARGLSERSARLLGAADRLRKALGSGRQEYLSRGYLHRITSLYAAVEASTSLQAAFREGLEMTPEQAVRYALGADDQWPPASSS